MRDFFQKHPFAKRLAERVVTIGVSWVAVVVCLVVTLFVLGAMFIPDINPRSEGGYSYVYGDGTNELLSIKVSGVITGTETYGLGFLDESQTAGYEVKDKLYAATQDDLINGVILEIDSPGGTIYGSRAIADGVEYYKKQTGNPVFVYIEGQAASGGYYASSSADKIIADYGSDIGGIGVIMGPFQYYNGVVAEDGGLLVGGVVTQKGIENTYITAGKSKDAGNPYRKLTNDELASLQKSVNNEYADFVQYVSKHRDIPEATLRNTIGAMSYDNKTAKEFKLIDEIGSRDFAYNELAKEAGIEDDFTVIREEGALGFVESLLSSFARKSQPKAQDACALTRGLLVYHGDVASFCSVKQ